LSQQFSKQSRSGQILLKLQLLYPLSDGIQIAKQSLAIVEW